MYYLTMPIASLTIEFMIDVLNGVLHRIQHYFSHITAAAHIIHVFPGFCQY